MNLRYLAIEICEWCNSNFDIHLPHLGVAEEIGELTHCILKREQKIRHMGDPEKFIAATKDALADATVYLLHYCGVNDVFINENKLIRVRNLSPSFEMEQSLIASMVRLSAEIIDEHLMAVPSNTSVTQMFQKLREFATLQNLDLVEDCLIPEWEKVKQRNWRKFPKNGLTE